MENNFIPLPEKTERKAGFEFEYTGLAIKKCAQLINQEFGGTINEITPLVINIENTQLKTIKIEADWSFAKKMAELELAGQPPQIKEFIHKSIRAFGNTETFIVPWEIVTEPLEFSLFPHLDRMRALLLKNEARGVSDSFAFAFGLHINCEVVSKKAESILSHLKAFLILYPELLKTLDVHPTRRVLSYIDPFPSNYQKMVLAPSYQPSLDQLINDYLKYNNTRNRALDLLPLFCHLVPKTIDMLSKQTSSLVKPRPTYHYRLPNCDFGNPSWRVSHAWNSWVAIETLAQNKKELTEQSAHFLKSLNQPISDFLKEKLKDWIE